MEKLAAGGIDQHVSWRERERVTHLAGLISEGELVSGWMPQETAGLWVFVQPPGQ